MRKGKRLIAMVLAMAVALGSVCWKPPEAKAVVIDATVAFGAAAATAAINGTTATTLFTGMSTSAATTAMTTLMGEYATATGAAASGTAFAASIGASAVVTAAGALVIGAAAGYALWQFIKWLREDKGLEAGGNPAPLYSSAFLSDYPVTEIGLGDVSVLTNTGAFVITLKSFTSPVYTFNGYSYYSAYPSQPHYYSGFLFSSTPFECTLSVKSCGNFYVCSLGGIRKSKLQNHDSFVQLPDVPSSGISVLFDQIFSLPLVSEDLIFEPNSEFQTIPQEIPDGQAMVISGIENLPQDDPQAAADAIMQTAIDGALAPVVTVEADPTVDTDPDTGTETDPDTGIDSDTNTSILDWLKQIWESICNIPSAIAEAIASIFVPSPDFYPTAISNLKDAFSDRMGLLTYPISVLFDFLDRVVNLSEQQPILTWGNIYLPGYATPLVAAGQYNLNDAIGTSQGKQLHDIYLVIVDAIMVLAFVDLCRHKYQKIIHN